MLSPADGRLLWARRQVTLPTAFSLMMGGVPGLIRGPRDWAYCKPQAHIRFPCGMAGSCYSTAIAFFHTGHRWWVAGMAGLPGTWTIPSSCLGIVGPGTAVTRALCNSGMTRFSRVTIRTGSMWKAMVRWIRHVMRHRRIRTVRTLVKWCAGGCPRIGRRETVPDPAASMLWNQHVYKARLQRARTPNGE